MARVLFALVLVAVLLEGGARVALRFLGAPIQLGWESDEGGARARDRLYQPDEELFFRLRPNLALAATGNPRIFDVRTDAFGLRAGPASREKPPGTWRVVAVGDSCTFGSGAGQADTWPARLERALAERRPDLRFEVINAGVPGFSSHQALRYLEIEGFDFAPDAVILSSAINDASPATAGAKRRFGEGRMLTDREYADALRVHRGLGLTRLLWRAGLGFAAPSSAPTAGDTVKRRVPLADYRDNVSRFVDESRARAALPVLLTWPLESEARGSPDPEIEPVLRRYRDAARSAADGALEVDLVPLARGHGDWFVDAVHMNPAGYAAVAQRIAEALAPELPEPR